MSIRVEKRKRGETQIQEKKETTMNCEECPTVIFKYLLGFEATGKPIVTCLAKPYNCETYLNLGKVFREEKEKESEPKERKQKIETFIEKVGVGWNPETRTFAGYEEYKIRVRDNMAVKVEKLEKK